MNRTYSGFFEENSLTQDDTQNRQENKKIENISFMKNFNYFYNVTHKLDLNNEKNLVKKNPKFFKDFQFTRNIQNHRSRRSYQPQPTL